MENPLFRVLISFKSKFRGLFHCLFTASPPQSHRLVLFFCCKTGITPCQEFIGTSIIGWKSEIEFRLGDFKKTRIQKLKNVKLGLMTLLKHILQ